MRWLCAFILSVAALTYTSLAFAYDVKPILTPGEYAYYEYTDDGNVIAGGKLEVKSIPDSVNVIVSVGNFLRPNPESKRTTTVGFCNADAICVPFVDKILCVDPEITYNMYKGVDGNVLDISAFTLEVTGDSIKIVDVSNGADKYNCVRYGMDGDVFTRGVKMRKGSKISGLDE